MPNGVSYRIALPIDSPTADGIIQIVAPSKYGWCGFAWGGRMTGNPFTIAWPSKAATGEMITVSNRWATCGSLFFVFNTLHRYLTVILTTPQRILLRPGRLYRSITHVPSHQSVYNQHDPLDRHSEVPGMYQMGYYEHRDGVERDICVRVLNCSSEHSGEQHEQLQRTRKPGEMDT